MSSFLHLTCSFDHFLFLFFLQLQLSPALTERLRVFEFFREKRDRRKGAEVTEKPLTIRLVDEHTVKGRAGVTTPLLVAQSLR